MKACWETILWLSQHNCTSVHIAFFPTMHPSHINTHTHAHTHAHVHTHTHLHTRTHPQFHTPLQTHNNTHTHIAFCTSVPIIHCTLHTAPIHTDYPGRLWKRRKNVHFEKVAWLTTSLYILYTVYKHSSVNCCAMTNFFSGFAVFKIRGKTCNL